MSTGIFNPPGLSQLEYRIGTFASFLAEMKGRLASAELPELAGLTTREGSDPAIALLDAWAIVADVLTFYQERMANEGFLRTAIEKRSVFELANLVGFKRRPGVAAAVFLAYGLEKDAHLTIKKGSRTQSVPAGSGDLPQTYETSQDLIARAEWNNFRPRLTIPQNVSDATRVIYFKGASLGLKPNDPLLFVTKSPTAKDAVRFVRIHAVEESFEKGITRVVLDPPPVETLPPDGLPLTTTVLDVAQRLRGARSAASTAPAVESGESASPLNPSRLGEVVAELDPRVSLDQLNAAIHADMPEAIATEVHAFRVHSAPFGNSAPKMPVFAIATRSDALGGVVPERGLIGYQEWQLGVSDVLTPGGTPGKNMVGIEPSGSLTLEGAHETIRPDSWVALIRPVVSEKKTFSKLLLSRVARAESLSRSDYGVTTRATRITLGRFFDGPIKAPKELDVDPLKWDGWLQQEVEQAATSLPRATTFQASPGASAFRTIRETAVYAQSERLELADMPLSEPVRDDQIELDSSYDGIDEGRWLIVEGERIDLLADPPKTDVGQEQATGEAPKIVPSGVRTAELVRAASVTQAATHGRGDTRHSHLIVSPSLAHAYKRDTVVIRGNVVLATHGDTRKEVLGSGDATRPYQTLALRQSPITFVPAATASGAATSLELRVNNIRWHEVESFVNANADDRVFVAELDDKGGARVIFGDGKRGARVPSGIENVAAQYRVGIGAAGNTKAGLVSQLMDRPPGAKEVGNPLPASGGADPDTPDQARSIAPLSVKALDRLVSVSDYRDFAQLFAGIAKATASEEWQGMRRKIVVTVAAAGGLPIAGSALHRSLLAAMRQLGDPSRFVEVVDFDRYLLVLEAGVRLHADYSFESVQPRLQQALLDALSFERRRLGDDLPLAQVLALMHGIEGVHSVDVDLFATISAEDVKTAESVASKIDALRAGGLPPVRLPASPIASGFLIYASPRVPGTLRLQEIP